MLRTLSMFAIACATSGILHLGLAAFFPDSLGGSWVRAVGWRMASDDLLSWAFLPTLLLLPAIVAYVIVDAQGRGRLLAFSVFCLVMIVIGVWRLPASFVFNPDGQRTWSSVAGVYIAGAYISAGTFAWICSLIVLPNKPRQPTPDEHSHVI